MAVYTEVSFEDLERLLEQYDIGQPLSFKGIAEGVENSNYLLQTEGGTYILTLYEKRVAKVDLPFFLGLMEHLADRGITCPRPIKGRDGAATGPDGKVAALVYLEPIGGGATSDDPETRRLLARQQALTEQLAALRQRQGSMPAADFDREFEALVLELATVSQQVRQRNGR